MGELLDLPAKDDRSKQAARGGKLSRTQRRAKVLRLVGRGFTHAQVAEQVGITENQVSKIVSWALERYRGSVQADIENVRRLQLERLDLATAVVMDQVTKGNLKAVDRLVRIERTRAKIAGTESARRHEHTHTGRIEHGVDRDEVQRLENEWLRTGGEVVDGTAAELPTGG